ncbi:MAG: hypothetical protein WCF17_02655, partial [Terracidiphilus sp.]
GKKATSLIGALGLMTAALAAGPALGQNLVVNGGFESGNSGFTTGYTLGDVSTPGGYFIGPSPSSATGAFGDWCKCGDHTTGTGNMMIVDGATSASTVVWEETVQVTPSTEYVFSYWGSEVDHDSNSFPHLAVQINDKEIGNSTFPEYSPDNGGKWENYTFKWNSGSSQSAKLVLIDLDTSDPWNDFAIDDISFSAVAGSSGGAAPSAGGVSRSGPITTHAEVSVKNMQDVTIPLKPEEKIAVMFIEAFGSLETECDNFFNRRCSLAELVAGPKSPKWKTGRLKYDPARDPNYKYTVTITGTGWTASANPQRAGLGGFFMDCSRGIIPDTYYNAGGPASVNDTRLGEISVSGEIFQVQ